METVSHAAPSATPVTPSSQDAAALPAAPFARRLAASGTGIAVGISGDHLDVLIVRVRPSRVSLVAYQRFANIKERPAAEVGTDFARFLKSHGVPHLASWVLLPRTDTIVRTLSLPGVAAKDLESAVELQLETLHPYLDEEVRFGFVRIGRTPQVLVGICREQVLDRWISLFEEAGIKIAGFTFSADALYRSFRGLRQPPQGFVTAIPDGDAVELYGESPARPIYNALLYAGAEMALAQARSELRLQEEGSVAELAALLPAPDSLDAAEFAQEHPLLYATALGAAQTFPAPAANLLPVELRKGRNWTLFLPTFILLGVLLLLVAGMFGQRAWNDRVYRQRLSAEIQTLEQQVALGRRLDDDGERFLARLEALREYRTRTKADLDALRAVTSILPNEAWVRQLDLSRGDVSMMGEAARAGELLKALDGSPLFENSEFAMPLQRVEDREMFRIRVQREEPK